MIKTPFEACTSVDGKLRYPQSLPFLEQCGLALQAMKAFSDVMVETLQCQWSCFGLSWCSGGAEICSDQSPQSCCVDKCFRVNTMIPADAQCQSVFQVFKDI